MRVHSIKTTSKRNILKGIQIHLSNAAEEINFDTFGGTSKSWQFIADFGYIRIVWASVSDELGYVDAIQFFDENESLVYSVGILNNDSYTEWRFSERKELIGVYGWETEVINQLSFVSLDTECVNTGKFTTFTYETDFTYEVPLLI